MVTPIFREPVISRPIEDTTDLIDHLKPFLEKLLANDVSRVYYGDIGVYLPTHFQGPRKEQRAILVLQPAYDNLESRVASQETRLIGIDVIGLVNITPYFKADPKEAYGERQLSEIMKKIRVLLTQLQYHNLDGRVQDMKVEDIRWSWIQRDALSLRGASVRVEARIKVNRLMNVTT